VGVLERLRITYKPKKEETPQEREARLLREKHKPEKLKLIKF
jgi:hypothetical protein